MPVACGCHCCRAVLGDLLSLPHVAKQLQSPLRPHTTRDRENVNIAQVAAQPTWTKAGSPCSIEHIMSGEQLPALTQSEADCYSQVTQAIGWLTSATMKASCAACAAGATAIVNADKAVAAPAT